VGHDTAVSTADLDPAGVRVGWIDQVGIWPRPCTPPARTGRGASLWLPEKALSEEMIVVAAGEIGVPEY
jgi:hypothetical protein